MFAAGPNPTTGIDGCIDARQLRHEPYAAAGRLQSAAANTPNK
jgi:hypothetical protein